VPSAGRDFCDTKYTNHKIRTFLFFPSPSMKHALDDVSVPAPTRARIEHTATLRSCPRRDPLTCHDVMPHEALLDELSLAPSSFLFPGNGRINNDVLSVVRARLVVPSLFALVSFDVGVHNQEWRIREVCLDDRAPRTPDVSYIGYGHTGAAPLLDGRVAIYDWSTTTMHSYSRVSRAVTRGSPMALTWNALRCVQPTQCPGGFVVGYPEKKMLFVDAPDRSKPLALAPRNLIGRPDEDGRCGVYDTIANRFLVVQNLARHCLRVVTYDLHTDQWGARTGAVVPSTTTTDLVGVVSAKGRPVGVALTYSSFQTFQLDSRMAKIQMLAEAPFCRGDDDDSAWNVAAINCMDELLTMSNLGDCWVYSLAADRWRREPKFAAPVVREDQAIDALFMVGE